MAAFSNLLVETLNRKYPGLENEMGRTIYVSQGNISSKIRKTKQQDKLLLYENGVNAATCFFLKKNNYQFPPNTFFKISEPRANGLALIFASSFATWSNNASTALPTTYEARSGSTLLKVVGSLL